MNYNALRETINLYLNSFEANTGIYITKDGFIRVRPEDRTPSCKINKNGSFHCFGSKEHYSDIISLFYDGYDIYEKWKAELLPVPTQTVRSSLFCSVIMEVDNG